MRRFYFYLAFLLTLLTLGALSARADDFTLKGRVTDEGGNALELATVSCVEQGRVAMTSLKGDFQLTLASRDSVVVRFSMVGYQTRTRVLRHPRGTQTLQVVMHPMKALEEVVVTERRRQTTGTEQLDLEAAKGTPSATGNAVEELIQQQAGVSTHSELSSQYNVRGGSFDENSVYINNVEIYRPLLVRSGQQEGLSVINADMVERVGFSTGGFEARYGDRMSSALDITYRRPTRPFEATATTSLLGASAYVGTGTKTFSMSHGLRYKTTRYLLGSLETTGEYRPNFLDYQAYLVWQPSSRWQLDVLGNVADNHYNFHPHDRETSFGTMEDVKSFRVYFDGQEKDVFRTYFGTASITHHVTPATQVKLLGSAFHTNEKETYDIQGQYWLDDTQTSENLGVGTYMEHARNYLKADVSSLKLMLNHKARRHDVELGLTQKWERVEEQAREWEMRDSSGYSVPHTAARLDLIYTLSSRNRMSSRRTEAYAQDVWRTQSEAGTLYTLSYGLRFAHWSFNRETIVSPRVSLAMVPAANQDIVWRLAAGLYYQAPFYKELRDTTTRNGVTVATLNSHIRSQRSLQFLASFNYRFRMNERPYRLTAEAYYKALGNLIPYNVQNVKVTYYGQNLCTGHTAGLDLKLYGEFVPGTDSWVTFSLMSSGQKFPEGQRVPLPTDQRYSLNFHFTDYFPGTERWKMTLRLAYADGLPFGAPHRGLEQQNFRAPAYKRADIGLSWLAYGKPQSQASPATPSALRRLWLGLDCLNLLGISNVNSYYWVTDVMNRQYAVPNYLTGRLLNLKLTAEF